MNRILLPILLLLFCAGCSEVTNLKIETQLNHKVGQASTIKMMQQKMGIVSDNVSGESFGNLDLTCIDNPIIKVEIVDKKNNDDCNSIIDFNSSVNNMTKKISERPITFERKDSTTIKISIACYKYDFLIRNFETNAKFQLTISSDKNKSIRDSVQFQLEK
ncbi:MAG: hypothetical protein ACK5RQ_03795 [Bacteroidota bacterium]|jgi:hypothetical protein